MPEMLSKDLFKACLAGEPVPAVPAWRFWFDGIYWDAHGDEIAKMQQRWCDDFARFDCQHTVRAIPRDDLPEGKFLDGWGAIFIESPDGVGSHPAEPIIRTVDDWHRYVDTEMPLVESGKYAAGVVAKRQAHPDKYVVGNVWRTFYERMFMLMGYEELMIEIATEGDLFMAMLPALKDFTIQCINEVADAGADAVYLADDWGTQHRLMISPAHFAKYFKPAYADMIDTAHSRGLDVWFHSCGQIMEALPHWIDIKLDVMSNLQTLALDLPEVARRFRGQMTFMGGIDVQYNIVHGSPETVRTEIRKLFEMFDARNGNYMASPCNSIMPETPIENVWAMMEAIEEFGTFES